MKNKYDVIWIWRKVDAAWVSMMWETGLAEILRSSGIIVREGKRSIGPPEGPPEELAKG